MVTDFPIQEVLDHLVRRIVDVLPVTAAGLTVISPGVEPRYVAASNESALRYEELQSELREGPSLATYHTGEAIAVPDLIRDDRFGAFASRAVAVGLAAMFTFPLRHENLTLGALDLYRDRPGDLSQASMAIAQTLADVAAAYLINAQTRSDLQDSTDQSRWAVLHDALTGLPNRVLIRERLEHAFLRGRRSGHTTAVFFVDLDDFKRHQRHLRSPDRRRAADSRRRAADRGSAARGQRGSPVGGRVRGAVRRPHRLLRR